MMANQNRHRAGGDALATVRLFEYMQTMKRDLANISLRGLNSNLDKEIIYQLPLEPGVYYFINKDQEIIYIGKSKNIRERVISHMSNNTTGKSVELREQIVDIYYELTGNELIALLFESTEIKKHQPVFNKFLKKSVFQFGLFDFIDDHGYHHLKISRSGNGLLPLTCYTSQKEGREHLHSLVEKYNLCQKLCGLYKSKGSCFQHQIGRCEGACIGKESPDDYNYRVNEVTDKYLYESQNFFIVGSGREAHEHSVVKVHCGRYCGFGYIGTEEADNLEILNDCIKPYPDDKDVQVIIKGYIRKNKNVNLVRYS